MDSAQLESAPPSRHAFAPLCWGAGLRAGIRREGSALALSPSVGPGGASLETIAHGSPQYYDIFKTTFGWNRGGYVGNALQLSPLKLMGLVG